MRVKGDEYRGNEADEEKVRSEETNIVTIFCDCIVCVKFSYEHNIDVQKLIIKITRLVCIKVKK